VLWNGSSTVVKIHYSDGTEETSSAVNPGNLSEGATTWLASQPGSSTGWAGTACDKIWATGALSGDEWTALVNEWAKGRMQWS
jgi:hypothetical protein